MIVLSITRIFRPSMSLRLIKDSLYVGRHTIERICAVLGHADQFERGE